MQSPRSLRMIPCRCFPPSNWLRAFDVNDLAFVYQEETSDGEASRFNKLVSR